MLDVIILSLLLSSSNILQVQSKLDDISQKINIIASSEENHEVALLNIRSLIVLLRRHIQELSDISNFKELDYAN